MSKFAERIAPIVEQLTDTVGMEGIECHKTVEANQAIMKNARQGDYLIKSTCKYHCYYGFGYLSYTYSGREGYYPVSCRRNAQYFSKEEAKEIIASLRHKDRDLTLVKRSKNGH